MYQSAELFFHFTTVFIPMYTPMGLLVCMCTMCVQVHKETGDSVRSYGTGLLQTSLYECRGPNSVL